MAAGEAVQLGIFTGLISLGLSRFLGTPTFPTFSSRDVEGGLAAVASPPSSPKSPIFPPALNPQFVALDTFHACCVAAR